MLALQGVLDAGGFLFRFVGSAGQDPEVAAVTGSRVERLAFPFDDAAWE